MLMATPKRKLRRCRICRRLRPDVSVRGKCWACVRKKIRDVAVQLHNHEGEHYEKWKESIKKAVARL